MTTLVSHQHRPHLVVTNYVQEEVIDFLSEFARVTANRSREPWSRRSLLEAAADADGLLMFMPDCVDADFLDHCPRLRSIAGALRGFDNFDLSACDAREIRYQFIPNLLAAPTAELTVAMLISLARSIPAGDAFVRTGQFPGWRPNFYSKGVINSTVGIVGMGQLGLEFAERMRGFGATLLYSDPIRLDRQSEQRLELQHVEFNDVIERSDHLVLMVPLTNDTLHLINADVLARCKPGAVLINPCRGSVVDEQAVVRALQSGQLGGYGADVFEMEDWARQDHPKSIPQALLDQRDHTVLTPHIGSAVQSIRDDIAMTAARNLKALVQTTLLPIR